MAKAQQGGKPDEFCDDGTTRKLNRSRPYGTVYSAMLDEWKGKPMPVEEAAFVQDNICYKGDGTPVGYVPAAERGLTPVEPTKEELLDENEKLRRQIETMMKRLDALERAKPDEMPATGRAPPPKEPAHAGGSKRV